LSAFHLALDVDVVVGAGDEGEVAVLGEEGAAFPQAPVVGELEEADLGAVEEARGQVVEGVEELGLFVAGLEQGPEQLFGRVLCKREGGRRYNMRHK